MSLSNFAAAVPSAAGLALGTAATLRVLRAMTADQQLPLVATPERAAFARRVAHTFGVAADDLPDIAVTLEEWASAISERRAPHAAFCLPAAAGQATTCCHGADALAAEARGLAELLLPESAPARSLISWLDAHTVAGFMFSAVLPGQAGFDARSLLERPGMLEELGSGDVVVTTADGWRQLAPRLPERLAGVMLVAVEPLDAPTRAALAARGAAGVIELYAQPDTGTLAARSGAEEAFALLPHWHPTESADFILQLLPGHPPAEVRLANPLAWVGGRHFVHRQPAPAEPVVDAARPHVA